MTALGRMRPAGGCHSGPFVGTDHQLRSAWLNNFEPGAPTVAPYSLIVMSENFMHGEHTHWIAVVRQAASRLSRQCGDALQHAGDVEKLFRAAGQCAWRRRSTSARVFRARRGSGRLGGRRRHLGRGHGWRLRLNCGRCWSKPRLYATARFASICALGNSREGAIFAFGSATCRRLRARLGEGHAAPEREAHHEGKIPFHCCS